MVTAFPKLDPQQLKTLQQVIAQKFAGGTYNKPQLIEFDGSTFVIKFKRHEKERKRQELLSAIAYFLLFRRWMAPKHFRALTVFEEGVRLQSLTNIGARVAPVYFNSQDYFIQAHSGTSLDTVLPRRDHHTRIALIYDVLASLADLHERGQWHGGPQIRNLTLQDGQLFRIDFEERFGYYTPLPLAQSYDLILTFNSIKKFLDDDLELAKSLFHHYWQRHPEPELIPYLQKVYRWIRPILPLGRFLGRINKKNNDINTSLFFGRLLHEILPELQR